MKLPSLLLLIAFPAFASAESPAAARKSGIGPSVMPEKVANPSTEAISDKEFIARRAAANPNAELPKALPSEKSPYGLLELSTVIQNGAEFILVPKGSVLFCPETHQAKLVKQSGGTFQEWPVFLSHNRGWISTYEVTKDQVLGKAPISPESMERFKKGSSVIIATLQGGPVTVLAFHPGPAQKP